jgi:hypothetical protein
MEANNEELTQLKNSILELVGILNRTKSSHARIPEALDRNMKDLFEYVVRI